MSVTAAEAALHIAALHGHMSSCPDPVTARALFTPAIEAMQLWLSSAPTNKRSAEALAVEPAAKRTKLSTDVSPILQLSPELQLDVMQWLDAASLGRIEACCCLFQQPRRPRSVVQEAVSAAMGRKYHGQELGVRTWPRLLRLHEEMEEVVSQSRASGDLGRRLLDILHCAEDHESEDHEAEDIKANPYHLTRMHQVPQSVVPDTRLTTVVGGHTGICGVCPENGRRVQQDLRSTCVGRHL